jgi:hypothetical protein
MADLLSVATRAEAWVNQQVAGQQTVTLEEKDIA